MGHTAIDSMLTVVRALMLSPWLYAVIVVLAALDAFVPLVPSEAAVLLAGTYAALAGPNIALVIAAGAVGAILGDHIAYATGRSVGERLVRRSPEGSRTRRLHAWAVDATARRGGPVLVAARFLPGGRTATTLAMGASRFPLRRFVVFDAVACVAWATYCSSVGYLGGRVLGDHPVLATAAGMALALAVSAVVSAVVEASRRRRRAPVAS
jgi:membrane protein DedA with SNARE-associated domain